MIDPISQIIRRHAHTYNVIDTGFIEAAANELSALFAMSVQDNVILHTTAESILAGIMANPATNDMYDKIDVCNEAVELAHELLTQCAIKVQENADQRVSVALQ